jgi:hypothetical protein
MGKVADGGEGTAGSTAAVDRSGERGGGGSVCEMETEDMEKKGKGKMGPTARKLTCSGLVRFCGIQSRRNNRYIKKFVMETRIHSGLRFNLLIMIGRTRDRRAGLIPHLLTSGLIPSLMVCLS